MARRLLVEKVEARFLKGSHPAAVSLLCSIDVPSILIACTGELPGKFNKVKLAKFGSTEFAELVSYCSTVPHIVSENDIELDESLAPILHNTFKQIIAGLVWGEWFVKLGC